MGVELTTLPNGMRVITETMPHVESVSLGAWVEVGARHEQSELNGISHVLEHMAFKGTDTRSAQDLAEVIEDVGGSMNAYTSRENTAYYAKVLKNDVGLAVDVIADIMQNSTFDPVELDREKNVIIQEIHQSVDTPDDIIFDYFQETAYPKQALGRPVLGKVDIIANMKRDDIMAHMHQNYATTNTIFSAAGNVDHETMVSMVLDKFTKLVPASTLSTQKAIYSGGQYLEERDQLEQIHLLMGFEGVSYDDPQFYALSVLSTLFGGGMSSRLFQEIREKRGLVYSVYSFVSSYIDGGVFAIYAGTTPDEVKELMPALKSEMQKVSEEITDAEMKRACAQLKASILMSMESTSTRCEQLARQMIVYGRPIPSDEIIQNIDRLTKKDISDVAAKVFSTPVTLGAVGAGAKEELFVGI